MSLAQQVKELREKTGMGPLDCKKALDAAGGDMDKAVEILEEKAKARGIKIQGKGRTANEGIIGSYIHFDQRLAVIVEVNCETDFVANTDNFQAFAKDIAMHIANLKPQYVKREDVPAEVVEAEKQVQLERALGEGKPEEIAQKIVEGRMNKWYEEICLLEQPFIKDDEKTIQQLMEETVADVGETINIGEFKRIAIGESADEE
jgi:elongation factor Ts